MIKVEELKKTYDKRTKHANEVLHGISFTLPDKGFVCILGASGCGKTSLLNAIGGLDVFDSGRIITETATVTRASSPEMERERNSSFGYIFQNYYLLAEHSVAYNVYLGMHSMPLTEKEKMARVRESLQRVDMLRYRKRPVGELSGGQQQRVAIARALARRPKVIFADEPTGNLDDANTMNICSILKRLSKESLIVMVTHEERIARFFADRIITLSEGKILSDTTEWSRDIMDAGAKDTLYSGDYEERRISSEEVSLRVLNRKNAPPVDITVVIEEGKIVVKVDDPRIVLCSETGAAPHLEEGSRPFISPESFEVDGEEDPDPSVKEGGGPPKKTKRGLDLKMLVREAVSLVSEKKLRRFGTAAFIILLTFMLAVSIADIVTIAHINPEGFITTDSHSLGFRFDRGANMGDKNQSVYPYISSFRQFLDSSGEDFDYIPSSSNILKFIDGTLPQFGNLSLNIRNCSWVNISRLDPSTIISGRMPERSDEVVIDRWAIDKLLSMDGIIQNIIPNRDYLLDKTLVSARQTFRVKIVGICDSGEPSIYMSDEAMLAYGTCGTEVITLSEYKSITGDTDIGPLAPNECIVIEENAPIISETTGVSIYIGSGYDLRMVDTVPHTDSSITAKFIIADETLAPLYRSMIDSLDGFSLWCSDKDALCEIIVEEYPDELKGILDVEIIDTYSKNYSEYLAKITAKLDARTIVTFTVIVACGVMLYLMQRAKIRERMDLVAVYRLLGIPKGNLLFVFAAESLMLTVKYALPTVLAVWGLFFAATRVSMLSSLAMIYPLWAAGLTFLVIAVYRLLVAVIPVWRLLGQPPAGIAAKYDF